MPPLLIPLLALGPCAASLVGFDDHCGNDSEAGERHKDHHGEHSHDHRSFLDARRSNICRATAMTIAPLPLTYNADHNKFENRVHSTFTIALLGGGQFVRSHRGLQMAKWLTGQCQFR